MKGFLGIDLGSTTTKAVFLSPSGEIIGRGLTNTRANFETASTIARSGALADARFTHLRQVLQADAQSSPERAEEIASMGRTEHSRAELRHRLSRLHSRCNDLVGSGGADAEKVKQGFDVLFNAIREKTERTGESLFGEALQAEVANQSEVACDETGVPYESLMGVFERALVADEADPATLDPRLALESMRDRSELSDAEKRGIDKACVEAVDIIAQAGTGYGRHRLPFAKDEIRSEILCHGLGCRSAYPSTRTILDIGGQDTKAIQLDEQGLVTSFQMNDRCAAGCGRYLGYVADELGLKLSELGPLALEADCPARINSTCTVFAGTEIRERLALGETREDVVAGLHRAIVVRAMSLLARSGGVRNALTFSGGVGRNQAVVKYLGELIAEHYGDITINVSADSIYAGCYGAALFAKMDARPSRVGAVAVTEATC